MKFIATFTPTIKIFLWIFAAISLVGIVVGILPLAGAHMEISTGQSWLLISVCSLALIVSTLLATIHYKVDKTHVRINIGFVDMLSGRIAINNILNIVLDNGKLYISYLWKGPDPVIALIAIKPKHYDEFKELLMSKNKNIVFTKTKTELLIASNNQHKIEEIKAVLGSKFDIITSLAEEGIDCDPDETGKTFYQNALIKARTIAQMTNKVILADDTGLCVKALKGRPGVYSARYAGNHDSAANRRKLLTELQTKKDRSAHFETVVVLLYPDGKVLTGKGKVDGHITEDEKGANGFGYDCIFYSTELGKTFAEATTEEKLAVSHRSRALRDLLSKL